MKIQKASTIGICFGVENAIKIALKARKETPYDQNVYILNPLVHNATITNELKKHNIIIDETKDSLSIKLERLPDNSGSVVFSAHGHDHKLDDIALKKNLKIYDATCPHVASNMKAIQNSLDKGHRVIYVGITNHPETLAALSISKNIFFIDYKTKFLPLLLIHEADVYNQTTLIKSELEDIYEKVRRIVHIPHFYNDICLATEKRQKAILEADNDVEAIIVLGDSSSSNSNRLLEVAQSTNQVPCYLASTLDEVINIPLKGKKKVFLTAGASTPKSFINQVEEYLENLN